MLFLFLPLSSFIKFFFLPNTQTLVLLSIFLDFSFLCSLAYFYNCCPPLLKPYVKVAPFSCFLSVLLFFFTPHQHYLYHCFLFYIKLALSFSFLYTFCHILLFFVYKHFIYSLYEYLLIFSNFNFFDHFLPFLFSIFTDLDFLYSFAILYTFIKHTEKIISMNTFF